MIRKIPTTKIKEVVDLSKYFTPWSGLFCFIYYSLCFFLLSRIFSLKNLKIVLTDELTTTDSERTVILITMMAGLILGILFLADLGNFIQNTFNYFEDRKYPLFKTKIQQGLQLVKVSNKFKPSCFIVREYYDVDNYCYYTIGFLYDNRQIAGSYLCYYFLASANKVYNISQFFLEFFNKYKKHQEEKNQLKKDKKEISKTVINSIINELNELEEK